MPRQAREPPAQAEFPDVRLQYRILWGPADATAADAAAVVVLRGPAIVNRNDLIWPTGATEPQIAAATAALAALGILLR
jgi:hypothetical protein